MKDFSWVIRWNEKANLLAQYLFIYGGITLIVILAMLTESDE